MKKSYILMMLLFAMMSTNVFAQNSMAQIRYYDKSYGNSFGISHIMDIDSIRFTTDDYDVYAYATPFITQEGEWGLKVSLSWAFSVSEVKVCVVDGVMTEEDILAAYDQGTLPEVKTIAATDSVYTTEFTIKDGVWKPVIFGFDKDGKKRSHYIGQEVNVSAEFLASILNPMMYGETSGHYGWGYGSIMRIRDVMGEEIVMNQYTGYDWYSPWSTNQGIGSGYAASQYIWRYFDNAIQKYSECIEMLNSPGVQKNPLAKVFLGAAVAYRAMHYLDAARMYEYLPNDATSSVNEHGNDVAGLTYPIGYSVDFAKDESREVRRATREEMLEYISSELDRAEELVKDEKIENKELVSLAVVYGLKARMHLWAGNYNDAQAYADKAINESLCQPLSEEEWEDPCYGFNDSSVSSWMWAMKYGSDNRWVTSGLLSWPSWCSNQTQYGYTGTVTGMVSLVSNSVYNEIPDTDFRKKSFKAPYGSPLYGEVKWVDGVDFHNLPDLTVMKFRPGKGNVVDNKIGNVVDVPLMRVEEMYFIRMEAMAQRGELAGSVAALNEFMKGYRNTEYTFEVSNVEGVVNEIFKQKRLEFFGEGINFFDYKRLNKPVVRSYEGTNCPPEYRLNTATRPAWMNFVFVVNAYGGKIEDWNNPDPSDKYPLQ